jgi:hypothetical protein
MVRAALRFLDRAAQLYLPCPVAVIALDGAAAPVQFARPWLRALAALQLDQPQPARGFVPVDGGGLTR